MQMFFQQKVNGTTLGGVVEPDAAFSAIVRIPCALVPEAVLYAACRVFAKSPALQREVLPASYKLRLRRGRKARPVCRCVQVPPQMFSLAAGQAYIEYDVTPGGVSVRRVWLLPADAPAPRRAQQLVLAAAAPVPQPAPAAQPPAAPAAPAAPRHRAPAPDRRGGWAAVLAALLETDPKDPAAA